MDPTKESLNPSFPSSVPTTASPAEWIVHEAIKDGEYALRIAIGMLQGIRETSELWDTCLSTSPDITIIREAITKLSLAREMRLRGLI